MSKSNFVWFEYVSGNQERAQGFFGELFNWKTQTMAIGADSYTLIAIGDRTIGGYGATTGSEQPHWLSYLAVADAKASAAKVASLGGKVVQAAFPVGDIGIMAIVTDPQGGTFALWQPLMTDPREPLKTAGTFTWNELYSKDPAASVAFYRALAELDVNAMGPSSEGGDMPGMGTYHVLMQGETPVAGIMAAQPGQPHAWLPYVKVDSADQTADKAKRLGANIVVPPTDIPNVGRFSIIADPLGTPIGVLQP